MLDTNDARWWSAFVERSTEEASRRGGGTFTDQGLVRLSPPDRSGEIIEVVQYMDDGLCKLTAGFITSVMASYIEYEDHNGVLPLILAVMDGHGREVVTIAADGSWLGAHSVIEIPTGGRTRSERLVPPRRLRGTPVDHTHVRPIEAWGP